MHTRRHPHSSVTVFSVCGSYVVYYVLYPSRNIHTILRVADVMPHARYSVQDSSGDFKLVGYDEYRKLNPRKPIPRYGVLDVVAQGTTCHYMNADAELEGFRSDLFAEAVPAHGIVVDFDSCQFVLQVDDILVEEVDAPPPPPIPSRFHVYSKV